MKTKAKSVEVYELRIWNKKYYGHKTTNHSNIFRGQIRDVKTNQNIFFNTPAQFLTVVERLYKTSQRRA